MAANLRCGLVNQNVYQYGSIGFMSFYAAEVAEFRHYMGDAILKRCKINCAVDAAQGQESKLSVVSFSRAGLEPDLFEFTDNLERLNRGNFINNFIEPAGLTENEEDEYEAWKRSEPIAGEGVDPIKYWVELRDRHPSLSKFAIDMLSIPGSSCECERLFSELGDLLEPRRRSISPQLLAAIQCDRRWIRAGFGSGEVPVKGVISDEEMDAKYGVHKWDIS
ncbi:Dimer-Tnp-hAT dimerization containing protein [Pyrenophora tritici-repentis]|uniref:Dimer-Tnp-hAT dimerization containing protein n=1 Tax=Pyrenophora tritici-repentis TaxID=45151 RepID=A0A317A2F3_9PLEO|nr:Dimer-Tnp-hAT dimerization containing protein [Pyrenophora tritici-repentis]KAI1682008.1 Dimer-Tnp-hAT dimerization containing protein [Pyrenophora tritici-repentis]